MNKGINKGSFKFYFFKFGGNMTVRTIEQRNKISFTKKNKHREQKT